MAAAGTDDTFGPNPSRGGKTPKQEWDGQV